MLYTLKNQHLSLTVDTLGAQMRSILGADGTEYLWQGDPVYWEDQAPNLFPFIGRLTDNSYTYLGQPYPMGIHGFAAGEEFSAAACSDTQLVLELRNTEKTEKSYPFRFLFRIVYQLQENKIAITFHVENLDEKCMPFGIGGHPGFNVPLEKEKSFDDYVLEFSTPCLPTRIGFTPTVYMSGHDTPMPLRNGRYLDLSHSLFDEDAIILKDMAREVTLRCRTGGKGVRVSYPQMPYLGFWHWPKKDAPYVCIEPWSSLPARQDVVEEFSCKSDLIQLNAGQVYENSWSITVLDETTKGATK